MRAPGWAQFPPLPPVDRRRTRGTTNMLDDPNPNPIADETRAFIEGRFHSVAEIEVFLHLVRAGGAWSPERAGSATGLGQSHAQVTLEALERAGLVRRVDGLYQAAPEASADAEGLDDAYSRFRMRVIELVAAGAGEEVADDVTER